MTPSERWLTWLLRLMGTAAILAVVAVFMPRWWMEQAHETLGLGAFPQGPIAEYLARYTSLFYVLAGVVQWWLSLDVRRYGRAIVGAGVLLALSGMAILWIDIQSGMPTWWTVIEAPFTLAVGVAYLVLHFRSQVEVLHAAHEAERPEPEEAGAEDAVVEPAPPAAPPEKVEEAEPIAPPAEDRFPAPLAHAGGAGLGSVFRAADESEEPLEPGPDDTAIDEEAPGTDVPSGPESDAVAPDETPDKTDDEDEPSPPGPGV